MNLLKITFIQEGFLLGPKMNESAVGWGNTFIATKLKSICNPQFSKIRCIFQDNYNKKIAPFSFDKINNVNIPVNINVSMSVIDIIKIAEVNDDWEHCCARSLDIWNKNMQQWSSGWTITSGQRHGCGGCDHGDEKPRVELQWYIVGRWW